MSTERFRLVVVSAARATLVDAAAGRPHAGRVKALADRHGRAVTVSVIELREIAADISTALVSQLVTPRLRQAITALGEADGIVAAAPVYRRPQRPVQLVLPRTGQRPADRQAGGAGGHRRDRPARPGRGRSDAPDVRLPARHDRADFAVRRPRDWSDPALNTRIDRAARELVLLMESGLEGKIKDEAWLMLRRRVRQRAAAPRPASTWTPT